MKKISIFLMLLSLYINIISCKQKTIENHKFEWDAGASSPEHYPAEPVYVSFTAANGSRTTTPGMAISGTNPWGENGISSSRSDNLKALPVKLDIKWLSYAEDQFYTGSFDLPYDKILTLFQKGYEQRINSDSTNHIPYTDIIAGMAPGGLVVVWVKGLDGSAIEVAHYQASKTKMDPETFTYALGSELKVSSVYVRETLGEERVKYIAKHSIPLGLWNTYRERFNWHPVIHFDQSPKVEPKELTLVYSNGEQEKLFSKDITENPFRMRARLKEIDIDWAITDPESQMQSNFWAPIKFDETEMLRAYSEAYENDPNQPAELLIDIDRTNMHYRCYLLTKGKKIELKKMQGDIQTNA